MDCWGERFELSSGAGDEETLMCAGACSEIVFPLSMGEGGITFGKTFGIL